MQTPSLLIKQDISPRLTRVLDELESLTRDIAGDEDMIQYLIEMGELTARRDA